MCSAGVFLTCFEQAVRRWRPSCGCGENVEGRFGIAGDGGEVNLGGGFGETAPSHSTETAAALSGAEDLLDPAAAVMDGLVPGLQPCSS